MKSILLFSAAFTLATTLNAQPIITADEYLTSEEELDTLNALLIPETFSVGDAGADVVWDFSDLPPSGTYNVTLVAPCPGNAVCDEFPGTTHFSRGMNSANPGQYSNAALKKYADRVENIGGQNYDDPPYTYTDPKISTRFPMEYLQSFSDAYAIGSTSAGVETTKVDGYGTLKTPAGIYNNVLRIKKTGTDTTFDAAGDIELISTYESYTWTSAADYGIMIAAYGTVIYPTVLPTQGGILYSRIPPQPTTGIEQLAGDQSGIMLCPNPAHNAFQLIFKSPANNAQLKIFSADGRVVLQNNLSGNNTNVDISSLSSGIYYVEITDGKNRSIHKLIKE